MPVELIDQVAALLESGQGLSRNREQGESGGARGGQLLRLFRVYSALSAELERAARNGGARVEARLAGQGLELAVSDPDLRYLHACLIPPELTPFFLARLAELGFSLQPPEPGA